MARNAETCMKASSDKVNSSLFKSCSHEYDGATMGDELLHRKKI